VKIELDHLGINVVQRVDNGERAGRKIADAGELLIQEEAWVITFVGLRDGAPEQEWEVPGGYGSAMLIKSRRENGRRRLQVFRPGKTANSSPSVTVDVSLSKYATAPSDIHDWHERVEQEERDFDELATGKKAEKVKYPAKPAERHLFDALLRAETAAQVRRICRRSEFWLKYRWEFGSGHFFEAPSACPRVLYERAEDFCQGKLDPRYPVLDKRASGDYRRIEHLARVMAGSSLVKPISPSYAVDVLRKMKHLRKCTCWRCTLGIAPRQRRSLVQFLISLDKTVEASR
jgi:hypothetical protein